MCLFICWICFQHLCVIKGLVCGSGMYRLWTKSTTLHWLLWWHHRSYASLQYKCTVAFHCYTQIPSAFAAFTVFVPCIDEATVTSAQDIWGLIHSHFVHSISNSMVDHFDIDSINALIFCTNCLMTISFNRCRYMCIWSK